MKKLIIFVMLGLLAHNPAAAQTYALAQTPKAQYLSNTGMILPGARLCTFVAGTTTPKTSYSDAAGTPNTNPVIFDSAGRANIWVNSDAYKFILYNRLSGAPDTCPYTGALIWSVDNIRDYGLVAFESGVITGSGVIDTCAQWASDSQLTSTSFPCGTITGSATIGVFPKFVSTSAIGQSSLSEDTSGGPGFTVIKANARVLINGTASDQSQGGMVSLGAIVEANSATNAQTVYITALGGGSGRGTLASGHTGTGETKKLSLGFDGLDGVNAYVPALEFDPTTTAATFSADIKGPTYSTTTNCADSAGAAACGSAAAGAFVIDASSTSTVVSTTAVTANSEIMVQTDSSLGTRLGVTCNTQSSLTLGSPRVTARTAATSFTVTIEVGPTTDPLCLTYKIVN